MELILGLTWFAISIAVLVDANHLEVQRGGLGGGFLDMGPAGWFCACILGGLFVLPLYLIKRPRLEARHRALRASNGAGMYSTNPYQPPVRVVPPGWYPDPAGPGYRWWDGNSWTSRVA